MNAEERSAAELLQFEAKPQKRNQMDTPRPEEISTLFLLCGREVIGFFPLNGACTGTELESHDQFVCLWNTSPEPKAQTPPPPNVNIYIYICMYVSESVSVSVWWHISLIGCKDQAV